ncbi:MAG: LysE family translocator [Gammaproteobacteria bacterium]|nr:LysE family translocator [Gammaproteobacteria bacterium]MBU2058278.1 LysE family translocator [Gammaproteobacteria bacterium]MBU2176669.1 LysE family translocator [Gammaproteobacteria bacterium]MBU2248389.1 LysE family translocator [Gammaproteobacteria bacterium]MBU2345748.1 LysE family translocator [Gammaproteobacteria bacterium]
MTLSLVTSMALFAFAASFSPGPVNLVSVSNGARYGVVKGLSFITGATLGFILLFLIIGFGLHHILTALPVLTIVLQWLGIAFLLYLSYQLFSDSGELNNNSEAKAPDFITGALMQWLNPKAWLASLSGIAAYIPEASTEQLLIFASLYLPICWFSLAAWLWAGIVLGHYLQSPARMRVLNKTLALLLAASCILILL